MVRKFFFVIALAGFAGISQARDSSAIWIEADKPVSTNAKISAWTPEGTQNLLSDGKWLTVGNPLPPEGAVLTYAFTSPAGRREVWHRVGYEAARSPFEWRIDGGDWSRIDPKTHTIDSVQLSEWNQLAWLDMGSIDLSAGDHKLGIRIPKPAKGDALYGSAAFALVDGPFHPNGKWKPGENSLTARDQAAAALVRAIPDKPGPLRQTLRLGGDWQIARDDELNPGPVAEPMQPINPDPVWTAISVPGDKATVRPDLALAHRVWYRTQISVPADQIGRSFVLTFHQNSLNTTVIVNGRLCGFNKNPFVLWSCDVSPAMHAGINDVRVGIRDAWYAFSQNPKDPSAIWESFGIPKSRQNQGFLHLDYPVWGCFDSGLLDTPELTVGGSTYASDVFVRPSVSNHRLEADVTIQRDDTTSGPVTIGTEAVDTATGKVVQVWPARQAILSPGQETTLTIGGEWPNPVLWWPDHPKLYALRVFVAQHGIPIDISNTTFGFREWTVDGAHYLLNGFVWHGWAELVQGNDPKTWLANFRRTGQRFQRMAGQSQNDGIHWLGMPYDAALDWCDKNGVTVRRCGPLDGEAIGYMPVDEKGGIYLPLLKNARDQIVAQVKGERNHPSVNMWSIENEFLYINTLNLWGGLMDQFEAYTAGTIAAVRAVDPTRLAMTDGGSSGKGNVLPVQGDHYPYTNDPNDYPELAYGFQPNGAGRGRWTYDGKRPRYAGEDYFATGINPADYAWIQGESAFGGKAACHRGMAMVQRMITEGYRWSRVWTAFHLWIGDEGHEYHDKYVANAERAVFVRQYDSTFSSGQAVTRTLGLFNDSHSSDILSLHWQLVVGGKAIQAGRDAIGVVPGTSVHFGIPLQMPTVAKRTPAELRLELSAGGAVVFKDSKPMAVLPKPNFPKVRLGVYDPSGLVVKYLGSAGVAFRRLTSLSPIPAGLSVLLIGPNAVSAGDGSDALLDSYARGGGRVVVLEQDKPLKGGALPAGLKPAPGGGSFGFVEDPTHAAVTGLTDADFRGWGPHGRLYEKPYVKAERGTRSLVEVGPRLAQTALAEVRVGSGLLVVCQLQVAHNLAAGGPSRNLLANLVRFAGAYHRIELPARSAVSDVNLSRALDAIGLKRTDNPDPVAALQGNGIAVVSATPDNLRQLAGHLADLRAFTARGGYLVLNGLTPEGLADYDKIVGVEHLIRPFRMEKTGLAASRDPLAVGLTSGDVVMYSAEKMFDYNDDHYAAADIFSYIVDTDDVAPFAKLPNDDFYNTVNGFVSSDSWKYIFSFEVKDGPPAYTMTFPRAFTFKGMTWVGNGFYHKVKRIGLSFDGGPVVPFNVQPNTDPQDLTFSPPRTAKSIRLFILDWTKDPGVNHVVGIDNIYLRVARPQGWFDKVRPLLNLGGIVRYPQGKGGVVLVNLAFKDKEAVPENGLKKRSILAAILRNLNATFVTSQANP